MGYDAGPRLTEDLLRDTMSNELADVGFAQDSRRCGHVCEGRLASNRKGLGQAEADSGMQAEAFVMLRVTAFSCAYSFV